MRSVVEAVVAGFSFTSHERADIVQEALGRLVDSIRSGRYRGEAALTTFGYSVARFTCIEHERDAKARAAGGLEAVVCTSAGPEETLLRAEEHDRNLTALSRLPPQARELLHLIFIERLSYKDVGRRLGLSESAVKSRVHRCRLMLRDLANRGEAFEQR
ncbi:MAG: RNA polymerase sigma factor [Candidatus Polarisedimenticolia bacterium]